MLLALLLHSVVSLGLAVPSPQDDHARPEAVATTLEAFEDFEWEVEDFAPLLVALDEGRYAELVAVCESSLERGDVRWVTLWGRMLAEGLGVERDETRAVEALELAAETRYSVALHFLALMLRDGRGVETNPERAVELLRVAVERRHPASMRELGRMRLSGVGVEANRDEALRLLREASSLGDPAAPLDLARILLEGERTPRWFEEAARNLRFASYAPTRRDTALARLEELGRTAPVARREFAVALLMTGSAGSDAARVESLLVSARDDGDTIAGAWLGQLYLTAGHALHDEVKGMRTLEAAIADGSDLARWFLGVFLWRERAQYDAARQRGADLIVAAAEFAVPEAEHFLADSSVRTHPDFAMRRLPEPRRSLARHDPAVPSRIAAAARARRQLDPFQALLEELCARGKVEQARELLLQANTSSAATMFQYAEMLATGVLFGRPVERDPSAALVYYARAAEMGHPLAGLRAADLFLAEPRAKKDYAWLVAVLDRVHDDAARAPERIEPLREWRKRIVSRVEGPAAPSELDTTAHIVVGLLLQIDAQRADDPVPTLRASARAFEPVATGANETSPGDRIEAIMRLTALHLNSPLAGEDADGANALRWLELGVEQGDADSTTLLGSLLINGGSAIPVDGQRGRSLLMDAAVDLEDARAARFLAHLAHSESRHDDAFDWWAQGAKLGDAECQAKLAQGVSARYPHALLPHARLELSRLDPDLDARREQHARITELVMLTIESAKFGHERSKNWLSGALSHNQRPTVRALAANYRIEVVSTADLESLRALLECALLGEPWAMYMLGAYHVKGLEFEGSRLIAPEPARAEYWISRAKSAGVELEDWAEQVLLAKDWRETSTGAKALADYFPGEYLLEMPQPVLELMAGHVEEMRRLAEDHIRTRLAATPGAGFDERRDFEKRVRDDLEKRLQDWAKPLREQWSRERVHSVPTQPAGDPYAEALRFAIVFNKRLGPDFDGLVRAGAWLTLLSERDKSYAVTLELEGLTGSLGPAERPEVGRTARRFRETLKRFAPR